MSSPSPFPGHPASSCAPDHTPCPRAHCFPLLLLFLLLAVIYANSFSGTWIFDDEPNIVSNPYVHMQSLDWKSVTRTFESIRGKSFDRPFAYLTFGLNYFFHGLDTWGYHLVNVTVHCLAALFLYLFIFQTLHLPRLRERYADRAGSIALLAAALWATSPIQVTSVTYIVQRMASMAALFFIMAMLFYLKGRIAPGAWRKVGWFGLCLVSGLLSLATKENAVMLPVCLYLFDVLLIQGVRRETLLRQLLPAAGVLAVLAILAFTLANPLNILSGYAAREFTLTERLLTQPRILLFYLSLMLYPMTDRFTLIYEVQLSTSLFTPWTTLPAILFWLGWTGLGVALGRKYPLVAFCLLFFVVNHLIESTFIPLELIYEHRNYLPSMTIFLLISMGVIWFLREFSQKRLLHVLTALVIVVTLAGQGHTVVQRNALFANPLLLWKDNAEKSPGLSLVHLNVGQKFSERGMFDEAKVAYTKGIFADRYNRLDLKANLLFNIGNRYAHDGNLLKAKDMYENALLVNQNYWQARFGLANILINLDELIDAKQHAEHLVALLPNNNVIRSLYSLILLKMNQERLAIAEASKSLLFDLQVGVAHKVLGEAYTRLEMHAFANIFWKQYYHAHPKDIESLIALLMLFKKNEDNINLQKISFELLNKFGSWDELLENLKKIEESKKRIISFNACEVFAVIAVGINNVNIKLKDIFDVDCGIAPKTM